MDPLAMSISNILVTFPPLKLIERFVVNSFISYCNEISTLTFEMPIRNTMETRVQRYRPLIRYVKSQVGHFPRHRLQRKPLVSDPGMHHGTRVTHVPWCMLGSLMRAGGGGGGNHSGIPGACATRNFTHLARGHHVQLTDNSWSSNEIMAWILRA